MTHQNEKDPYISLALYCACAATGVVPEPLESHSTLEKKSKSLIPSTAEMNFIVDILAGRSEVLSILKSGKLRAEGKLVTLRPIAKSGKTLAERGFTEKVHGYSIISKFNWPDTEDNEIVDWTNSSHPSRGPGIRGTRPRCSHCLFRSQ